MTEVRSGMPEGLFKKGFDCYLHIDAALANSVVRMRWPVDSGGTAKHSKEWPGPLNMAQTQDVVIDTGDLPWNEFIGALEWVAFASKLDFPPHAVTVNPVTGGAVGGDLANMLHTPSVPSRADGTALSFGFWDSGGMRSGSVDCQGTIRPMSTLPAPTKTGWAISWSPNPG